MVCGCLCAHPIMGVCACVYPNMLLSHLHTTPSMLGVPAPPCQEPLPKTPVPPSLNICSLQAPRNNYMSSPIAKLRYRQPW